VSETIKALSRCAAAVQAALEGGRSDKHAPDNQYERILPKGSIAKGQNSRPPSARTGERPKNAKFLTYYPGEMFLSKNKAIGVVT